MDLIGQYIVACLEEDDTRRVLFRVRPLMMASGPITQEDLVEYGQEGWLRIAPDKQEQFTFKERMQALGPLCLLNLQDPASAMHKVRPNKNYAPSRGEINRYIIYSDAVQPLPRDLIYEVLTEDKVVFSLTAQYYLRSGGRISGPHCPSGTISCPVSQSLPPDCEGLNLVDVPGLGSRMFYWPPEDQRLTETCMDGRISSLSAEPMNPQTSLQPFDVSAEQTTPFSSQWRMAAHHLWNALTCAGFSISEEESVCLLLLSAIQSRLQLNCDYLADAHLASRLIAGFLPNGWVSIDDGTTGQEAAKLRLLCQSKHAVARGEEQRYEMHPWPVVFLKSGQGVPKAFEVPRWMGVQVLVNELLAKEMANEWNHQALSSVFMQLSSRGHTLPLVIRAQMTQFLIACQSLFPDIKQEILAFAIKAWIQPWLLTQGVEDEQIREFLTL